MVGVAVTGARVGKSVGIGEDDCMTSSRVGAADTGASLRGTGDALIKISSSIEGAGDETTVGANDPEGSRVGSGKLVGADDSVFD